MGKEDQRLLCHSFSAWSLPLLAPDYKWKWKWWRPCSCSVALLLSSFFSPLCVCEHLRPTSSWITFPCPIGLQKKEDTICMVATKNHFYMIWDPCAIWYKWPEWTCTPVVWKRLYISWLYEQQQLFHQLWCSVKSVPIAFMSSEKLCT